MSFINSPQHSDVVDGLNENSLHTDEDLDPFRTKDHPFSEPERSYQANRLSYLQKYSSFIKTGNYSNFGQGLTFWYKNSFER